MNDSKDFQDAESVRSGNSHVTSQPGVFPKHPPFEGLLRPPFLSQRQTDGPPNTLDTSGISGNVFAHPQASSSAPCPQGFNSIWKKTIEETNSHVYSGEKWKIRTSSRSEMPIWTVSQRFSHLQWRETLQRIMGQTNNDCRFRIFILTSSQHQQPLLAGR